MGSTLRYNKQVRKRLSLILSISIGGTCLIAAAVLLYNFQVRELAEKSTSIPILSTPISALYTAAPINGLNLENAIPVLEDNDFICSEKPEIYRESYYRISCEQKTPDYDMIIHIFSFDQKNITLVDAQINQLNTPSDDQATNFLGFIAQLPITGLDTASLKQWIKTTLPTLDKYPGMIADKTLNGLELRLYGPPHNRSIEIVTKK